MPTTLQQAADRVNDLARPRASVGIVAMVVLAGELIAMTLAWGATTIAEASLDQVMVTLAVVAAASAAIGQVTRSGHVAEPGHRWLLGGWIVIAALASTGVADLPLRLTQNPAGSPGVDRALFLVLVWTLAMAVAVLGADLRPTADRLPLGLMAALGVLGVVGGTLVDPGTLLDRGGPTTTYVLLIAAVLLVCLVAVVLWAARWQRRGGWSLTWSGTGLVLATTGVVLQLVAPFGNERIWVAATGMVLSSMIVPGLGALAAGTALAGARTIARRQLRDELEPSVEGQDAADLPMLQELHVELAPVVSLESGAPMGALAHVHLPGLSADWWRSQAATMGLGTRLEAALAARALQVVTRDADPATWVVVPVLASAVDDDVLAALTMDVTGNLVVIVRGSVKELSLALPRLAAQGVTTGVLVPGMDVRTLEAIDRADPALLVVDDRFVTRIAHDAPRRAAVQGIVAWAAGRQRGVLAVDVEDGADLAVLRGLGVRYAAGSATTGATVAAGIAPPAEALGLIEAAGLREPPTPGRS